MNELYRRLGIATVWMRTQEGAHEDQFGRRLRQVEAGAAELNLDAGAVQIAAEIAAMEPALDDAQRLALIVLITVSLAALQEGSTRFPVTGAEARQPMRRMLTALCGGDAGGPDEIAAAIERLLKSATASHVIGGSLAENKPLLYLPPFIYHHRVRAGELRLAQIAAQRLKQGQVNAAASRVEAALADIISRSQTNLALSDEQRAAVANAAGRAFTIVSGGPGSGKTSIVLAILRVLVRLGVRPDRIALAAPTGKAAFRMSESISEGLMRIENPAAADKSLQQTPPEASTVHRLLGYSPGGGRFTYHRNNPLQAEAVIVDEGSMLDLTLMERLMDAIKPEASLILLGDADQLPSVAAGAVFRDLVRALGTPAKKQYRGALTRLGRNYRMDATDPAGRSVLQTALAINAADNDLLAGGRLVRRAHAAELEFSGTEFLASPPMEEFLSRWYEVRLCDHDLEQLHGRIFGEDENGFGAADTAALERVFDHAAASRVLCFTRVLPAGSDRVNAALHRRRAGAAADEREFVPGEPVMVVRNDYERMLFNGDQGVIVRVRRRGGRAAPMAVFRSKGRFAAFHLAALRDALELCYATTIHKAQGSEFDAVAILLPDRDLPILTREALYTALTRSRRSVIIAGAEQMLQIGVGRAMERFSGLAEEVGRRL